MKKKLMMLGASALQVPAIKKAKEMGYEIILVDYDEHAVGFPLADVKLVVSTLDQEEVYRQALIHKPDVVMTSTSDGPVRTAAYVNEKLGKQPDLSYADSLCATIKSHMRNRLRERQVPIPEYYAVSDFAEFEEAVGKFCGNCIVKPADNAGSRGVVLMENGKRAGTEDKGEDKEDKEDKEAGDIKELKEIYAYSKSHSRNGTVMVEEFMQGPEVSVEAMTVEGKTQIITITDKYITPPPYFVELAHCEPSRLDEDMQEGIRQVALQAVQAVGLRNGPSHTEIKVTPEGPKVVELAARLGGDFITSRLVPLSTGVDMVGASVALATGAEADIRPKWKKAAAIHFLPAKEGIIRRISVDEEIWKLKGMEDVVIDKKAGDEVHGTKSSNDRLGYIITSADTPEEAMEAGEKAMGFLTVEWEG